MAKSTKFLSLIMFLVMLALVMSMAVLSFGIGRTAYAEGDVVTTVRCYIDAELSLSNQAPIADADKAYGDILIKIQENGALPQQEYLMQSAEEGIYTYTNLPADYGRDDYKIKYSVDGGLTWKEYDDGSVYQIKAGNIDNDGQPVDLFFYTLTLQESDGSNQQTVTSHYKSTVALPKYPDVIGEGESALLFKTWSNGTTQNGGNFTVDGTVQSLTAVRVAVDPNRFDVNRDGSVTVYSLDGLVSGKMQYGTSTEAITDVVTKFGNKDTTDMVLNIETNVNISTSCLLGVGKYTVTGDFVSSAHHGAFQLTDTNTQLTLKDATISTGTNTNGILLDQGSLVVEGTVNTGGLVVTSSNVDNRSLTVSTGATTEDNINLYYQDNSTDSGNTLNKTDDVGVQLLKVSGDVSSNFSLKNSNNYCGMKYNATTGTLDIAQKFAVVYKKMADETGQAPATQYVVEGDEVTILTADGLDKRGYEVDYSADAWQWYDYNTPTTKYKAGQNYLLTEDITVCAIWIPLTYEVIIEGTNLGSKTHTYGTATTVPTPTKEGFVFEYWLLDGVQTLPTDGKITLGATAYDSKTERTITLVAKWSLIAPTNVSCTDYQGQYDGTPHTISVSAEHPLANVILLYNWYKDGNLIDVSSNSLTAKDVADSGEYTCIVKAYAKDPDTSEWQYSQGVTVKGEVEITKIFIGITADDVQKKKGSKDPEFTYRITSGALAEGETLATLGARLTRVPGEDKGVYEIRFIYSNGNYQVAYTPAFLTIKGTNILAIVLPSVFGGLALVGGGIALAIVLVKKNKKKAQIADAVKAEDLAKQEGDIK